MLVSQVCHTSELLSTHLRKYCNPLLRFSRNLGRNFEITLFGGRGGIAAVEFGNVWRSLSRRSSNSEYRFLMRIEPPYYCQQVHLAIAGELYSKSIHGDIPDHKCAYACPAAIDNYIVLDIYILRPASFIL